MTHAVYWRHQGDAGPWHLYQRNLDAARAAELVAALRALGHEAEEMGRCSH